MEEAQIIASGDIKNGAIETPNVGFEYDNQDIKSKWNFSATKDPNFDFEFSWKACSGFHVGGTRKGNVMGLFKNDVESKTGMAGTFKDTGVFWGVSHGCIMNNFIFSKHMWDFYFQHKAGANTVGAHINYNNDAKKFSTVLGLQMKQDDHTWKFRFHDSGLMRVALQWQLHKICKATLNSSLQMRDVPAGSVSSLPLNLTLELKY